MASQWIKVEHVTPDKPEVWKIASATGLSPDAVIGKLLRLWIWADQQSLECHVDGVTFVTLDFLVRHDGFALAMCRAGWLHDNGDGSVTFPNFERHNGETAKSRGLSQIRQQKHRQKVTDESQKSNAAGVTDALPDEEEDIKDKEGKPSSSEHSPDGAGGKPASKPKPRTKHGTEEDYEAARWIFEQVRKVSPTAKAPNETAWANSIRLMREQDGRTHREICELFAWANRDPFWSANVLSPDKLREKWTQLDAKRGNAALPASTGNFDPLAHVNQNRRNGHAADSNVIEGTASRVD